LPPTVRLVTEALVTYCVVAKELVTVALERVALVADKFEMFDVEALVVEARTVVS